MNKLLILFLILNITKVYSNDSTQVENSLNGDSIQRHFLNISSLSSKYKYLDNQYSPIIYEGPSTGIKMGFESDGNKHKWDVLATGFFGYLEGTTKVVTYPASIYGFNFTGSYLHTIGKKNAIINTYLGGRVRQNFIFYSNSNLQNAASSFSSLNNLAITAEAEKYFSWKAKHYKIWFLKFNRRDRKLRLNFKLDIPFYFYNLRPPYSSISDFSDGKNLISVVPKSYWIFADAFQLNTSTSITYYMHNCNAIRISYLWEAYKFQDTFDSYQAGQHIFEFSLLFRLN